MFEFSCIYSPDFGDEEDVDSQVLMTTGTLPRAEFIKLIGVAQGIAELAHSFDGASAVKWFRTGKGMGARLVVVVPLGPARDFTEESKWRSGIWFVGQLLPQLQVPPIAAYRLVEIAYGQWRLLNGPPGPHNWPDLSVFLVTRDIAMIVAPEAMSLAPGYLDPATGREIQNIRAEHNVSDLLITTGNSAAAVWAGDQIDFSTRIRLQRLLAMQCLPNPALAPKTEAAVDTPGRGTSPQSPNVGVHLVEATSVVDNDSVIEETSSSPMPSSPTPSSTVSPSPQVPLAPSPESKRPRSSSPHGEPEDEEPEHSTLEAVQPLADNSTVDLDTTAHETSLSHDPTQTARGEGSKKASSSWFSLPEMPSMSLLAELPSLPKVTFPDMSLPAMPDLSLVSWTGASPAASMLKRWLPSQVDSAAENGSGDGLIVQDLKIFDADGKPLYASVFRRSLYTYTLLFPDPVVGINDVMPVFDALVGSLEGFSFAFTPPMRFYYLVYDEDNKTVTSTFPHEVPGSSANDLLPTLLSLPIPPSQEVVRLGSTWLYFTKIEGGWAVFGKKRVSTQKSSLLGALHSDVQLWLEEYQRRKVAPTP